jgi:hypothetical protein
MAGCRELTSQRMAKFVAAKFFSTFDYLRDPLKFQVGFLSFFLLTRGDVLACPACVQLAQKPLQHWHLQAALETLNYCDYSLAIKSGVHFTLCGGTVAKLGTEKHHQCVWSGSGAAGNREAAVCVPGVGSSRMRRSRMRWALHAVLPRCAPALTTLCTCSNRCSILHKLDSLEWPGCFGMTVRGQSAVAVWQERDP